MTSKNKLKTTDTKNPTYYIFDSIIVVYNFFGGGGGYMHILAQKIKQGKSTRFIKIF